MLQARLRLRCPLWWAGGVRVLVVSGLCGEDGVSGESMSLAIHKVVSPPVG